MFIKFKDASMISYSYEPTVISIQKEKYLIVPDFFREISCLIIDDKEYLPSIIPEWLPFTICKIKDNEYPVYDKFLKIITINTSIIIGKYSQKVSNEMYTYHKIIPKCRNSPRFLLFSFDVKKDKIDNSFEKSMLKDSNNKLYGVYYYHEEFKDFYRFHYLPVTILVNIIEGRNSDVISLPFEKGKNISKIGKNNITKNNMFNSNYKLHIPIDINLMIEGQIDNSETVKYKGSKRKVKLNYYKINNYNEFIFKKGKHDGFSSQDGNEKIFNNYLEIIT